jgi:hypothetical protein
MTPTLATLTRQHPEHRANCHYWQILDAMLCGGSKLTPEIKAQLLCNPDGRPKAVHEQRVKVARYFNKMGPIANRFLSQLFNSDLTFEGSKDKFWKDSFFPGGALLPESDDDGRSSFNALLKAAVFQGLGQGKAIVQIDTAPATTNSRKEQRNRGEDEPYALLVPRCDLWDWKSDRYGFQFAKLHRFTWERDAWDSDPTARHDFTIYQRQPDGAVIVYRYVVRRVDKDGVLFKKNQQPDLERDGDLKPEIVNGLDGKPIFSHKGQSKFPIVTMAMPSALHLADQLHDAQVAHFNQTASLEYGLLTGNYSMLQITTKDAEDFRSRNQRHGDGYQLLLEEGESAAWLERGGATFNVSKDYRATIEEDIDKAVQQIALAAADAAGAASGETIRQARKPEEVLLGLYGAMVRDFAKGILDVAAIAHAEIPNWQIKGMDNFQNIDLTLTGQEYAGLSQAGIKSETFAKELQKSLARAAAQQKQFPADKINQIIDEIEKSQPDAAAGNPEGSGDESEVDDVDAILGDLE